MSLPPTIFTSKGEEIPFVIALDITLNTLTACAHHLSMSADPDDALIAGSIRAVLADFVQNTKG